MDLLEADGVYSVSACPALELLQPRSRVPTLFSSSPSLLTPSQTVAWPRQEAL